MKSIAALALLVAAGTASANLQVTEAYTGLSGPDGTEDWFEITWTGAGTFDTGTLAYDDSSADFASGGILDSFILNTGESAVFLIETTDSADITEFNSIWGGGINVGLANGGGALGQGGDTITIFDAATQQVLLSVDTPGGLSGDIRTIEYVNGVAQASITGVNGAYNSTIFTNDNGPDFGFPDDQVFLIGSPGQVPAPGAAVLAAAAGLAAARRRRA